MESPGNIPSPWAMLWPFLCWSPSVTGQLQEDGAHVPCDKAGIRWHSEIPCPYAITASGQLPLRQRAGREPWQPALATVFINE